MAGAFTRAGAYSEMKRAEAIATGTPMIMAKTEVTMVPVERTPDPEHRGAGFVGWVWKPVLVKKCQPCDRNAGRASVEEEEPDQERGRAGSRVRPPAPRP